MNRIHKGRFLFFGEGIAYNHNFYITRSGKLSAFGNNDKRKCWSSKTRFENSRSTRSYRYNTKVLFSPTICDLFPNVKVKKVALGYSHTIILTHDGVVYSRGSNSYGQLSHPMEVVKEIQVSKKIPDKESSEEFIIKCLQKDKIGQKIIDVACGYNHSIFVGYGSVFSSGRNRYGQLGHNTKTDVRIAKKIKNFSEHILQVGCGDSYTLFLTKQKELYCTGKVHITDNSSLNLVPKKICEKKAEKIACGNESFLFLDLNRKLWGTSYSQFGKEERSVTSLEKVKKLRHIIINEKIIDIRSGAYHNLVLTEDGKVYGNGYTGALGDKSKREKDLCLKENIVQIEACGDRSFLFDRDGTVWCSGINQGGQLGLGRNKERNAWNKNVELAKNIKFELVRGMDSYFPFGRNVIERPKVYYSDIVIKILN